MGDNIMGMIGVDIDSDPCCLSKRSRHIIGQLLLSVGIEFVPVVVLIDDES